MYKKMLFVLVGLSLLTGCGGGGGGSSSASLPSEYTGNTAQATVTTSNAKALSSSAYSASQMTSTVGVLGKVVTGSSDQSYLLEEVASILDNSVSTIAPGSKSSAKVVEATSTDQNTIYGYSGFYTYNVSVDTTSGATSGTLSFSQYKALSTSIAINGTITFTGVFNQTTSNFSNINMSVSSLSVTSSNVNVTMTGNFSLSISSSIKTFTMTMAITNNVSHSTVLIKDYALILNGSSLTVAGTYYDPTYGYVVISTIIPLTVPAISATPTSGQLLCTGSNGTKARLTFNTSGYIVEADTAGNGTYVVVP